MLNRERTMGEPFRRQAGLSIIELLVGVAIGLFIVGGATKLFVDYLTGTRNSLQEVRLNQDLRAAADLVVRDVRRAGYWQKAASGVWSSATTSVVTNAYANMTPASAPATAIAYNYAKDGDDDVGSNETFGFQLNSTTGTLQASLGSAGYQDITDPSSVRVTGFTVTPANLALVELYQTCPCLTKGTCTLNQFKNPNPDTSAKGTRFDTRPVLAIQKFEIRLSGESRTDSRVKRELVETVRVRNDKFSGNACVI